MGIFEENGKSLEKSHPRLWQKLQETPERQFRIETSKSGKRTLLFSAGQQPLYIHSKYDPEQESLKLLREHDLSAGHIILFGLGLGYLAEKILAFKTPGSRLLVIEPELEIVRHSLHVFDWSKALARPDCLFLIGPEPDSFSETVQKFIDLTAFDRDPEFIELPAETRLLTDRFAPLRARLDREIQIVLMDFKTYCAEGRLVPHNILKNIGWIIKTRPIAALKGRFSGVPGFIVAAGPSLDKNVLQLQRIADRAVIIAVDTALKPLLARFIQPHFTVVADPSYKNYLHLLGTEKEVQNFIIAETAVANPIFKDFCNRVITVSIGRPLMKMLEEFLPACGSINAWGSVISLAMGAAVYLGLDPIVFVGQDFAFTHLRHHCRWTSWEWRWREYSDDLDIKQRMEKHSIGGNRQVFTTKDILGQPTWTSDRLILYKNYLLSEMAKYPQVRFFNASEGGILAEIPALPLDQAIHDFVYGRPALDFASINSLPPLATAEAHSKLGAFFSAQHAFFKSYSERLREIIRQLQQPTDNTLQTSASLLQQANQVRKELYQNPKNGFITEMWSVEPIFNFLKKQRSIKTNSPVAETHERSLEVYKKYFLALQPVLESLCRDFSSAQTDLARSV